MNTSELSFKEWSAQQRDRVEHALGQWIDTHAPGNMAEPMRYAAMDGGKRLRPLLVLASCEAVSGNADAALRAACAIELIHAYSLVHDDMPCMDNDVLRRGKPTVHVQFGEATALLAGDGLQTLAFELLTPDDDTESNVPPTMQAQLCRILARASGYHGMVAGQAIDLAHVGKHMSLEQLQQMHELKTGALLLASVMLGAATAPTAISNEAKQHLQGYGKTIGLAFQVVDDILDVTADSSTLGKTAGKDAEANKPTYVSLLGLDAARAKAAELHDTAKQHLNALEQAGWNTEWLHAIAHLVIERGH